MKEPGDHGEAATADLDPAEVLSRADLFSVFSRDELDWLAAKSEFLACGDGVAIFEPGDPGDRLYLVASGSVEVLSSVDGSVLAQFVAGDSFGELELLTRTKRNARARAVGPTSLLTFPKGGESIETALSSRPAVAARILRSFLLVVAGRTRKANALVKENSPWVRELRRQVYGDKLTGLLNKTYLDENLPKMLSGPTALLMLKPDNFKEINDRFGHEIGDAALVLMAGELERAVGKEGTAVRYAGNELAVVFQGKDRKGAQGAARAIQDRLSSLDLSPLTQDPSLRFGISLGIALYPEHGADAEALVKACVGLPLVGRARGGKLILFPEDGE
ncbi:MAG TPA: GGDEF domain-containing protein [Rectinemataceae bacterium]|nr:GGDEF domain-containing protein [Rectinemataceae bacterium]